MHRATDDPGPQGWRTSGGANSTARAAGALIGVACIAGTPSIGLAQSYTVSVQETGPLSTVYQKRFNWRVLPGYRHTTMIASSTDPLACSESPCLDDGEAVDYPPDPTRGGTATATVGDVQPGAYQLELRYNQTVNRSTSVPWAVTTDSSGTPSRSGSLDQRHTAPGADNWLVLGSTDNNPIQVVSTLTFVLGSATTTFNGSLSYGGIRLVKIAEGTGGEGGGDVVDGGVPVDPACSPLRSREYDDAPAALDEALGSLVRLTFTIDEVPAPAGISHAELTMTLYDADHPGEEGMVYVNGHEPLALPAATTWNDASADAVLVVPPSHLMQGTNVIELGVGSRPTTYYEASRVVLQAFGPACEPVSDGGGGGTGAGGAGAGADGSSGAAGAAGAQQPAAGNGHTSSGCGCIQSSRRSATSPLALALLGGAMLVRRRSRSAPGRRQSFRRPNGHVRLAG